MASRVDPTANLVAGLPAAVERHLMHVYAVLELSPEDNLAEDGVQAVRELRASADALGKIASHLLDLDWSARTAPAP